MTPSVLPWLPESPDWGQKVGSLSVDLANAWPSLVELAGARMDFVRVGRLDRHLRALAGDGPPPDYAFTPIRLALLASSTTGHLLPGLRVAALRRGLWMTTYQVDYGQYLQELLDKDSALHRFKPNVVLFALDAPHVIGDVPEAATVVEADALVEQALSRLKGFWHQARESFSCQVIQQTLLPVFPSLVGNNEHRLPRSPLRLCRELNARLVELADAERVDVLALDARVAEDGLAAWHDPVLWHRAKQEITPSAAPFYGDMAVRLIAARLGRSAKCLVLDLDNTLWGGVIGDDGLEGIVLGQGSATGEAYVAFQNYARMLSERGIILAVCSKNDEANALAPFEQHSEMVLKRADIACFVANWQDKASNIRHIAQELNIGLDSLVFVDDNPAERDLVRRELPMVMVPELPEDPALYARCLSDSGYFETLSVTAEDLERNRLYGANRQREAMKASSTNMSDFLRSLEMELRWRRFDRMGLQRIVQLINKTNQFNLTTQRYGQPEIEAIMADPRSIGLQLSLVDRVGNNGIIAIVIGRMAADGGDMLIDTWLMSCRVLGRNVEEATLNLVAAEALKLGANQLIGEYRPTAKNSMVREHYSRLGFMELPQGEGGTTRWARPLADFIPFETFITTIEA
jgi:FkbH-like protein